MSALAVLAGDAAEGAAGMAAVISAVPAWRDFDPPICAVCEKPVDSIENYTNIVTLELVWVVRCHGEREEARLGQEYVELCGFNGLSFGRAFVNKRIAASPKQLESPK